MQGINSIAERYLNSPFSNLELSLLQSSELRVCPQCSFLAVRHNLKGGDPILFTVLAQIRFQLALLYKAQPAFMQSINSIIERSQIPPSQILNCPFSKVLNFEVCPQCSFFLVVRHNLKGGDPILFAVLALS
jgi:hypothetical protein